MLETTSLSRRFGTFVAVDDLNLRVADGAILALLGPNGAGKTTTVRMLAGLLRPSSGTARVAGYDVRDKPAAVRARVGLVTDVPGIHTQMTLPDYLMFFGQIYGLDAVTCRHRVADLIDFFELTGHQNERMVGFSKGMKQKVALARALLHDPKVIFMDEPTSGLDPLGARAVRDLITALKHARRTIILCTHDLSEAERLADEIAIIRGGRIVSYGSPAELRAGASPETMVRIELTESCPEAVEVLQRRPDILSATALRRGAQSLIVYRTTDPRETNPLVVGELVAMGAHVVSMSLETRTLEDVYATLAGEERTATCESNSIGDAVATIGAD